MRERVTEIVVFIIAALAIASTFVLDSVQSQLAAQAWRDLGSGQYTLIARDSATSTSNIRPVLVNSQGHLIVDTTTSVPASVTSLAFLTRTTTVASPQAVGTSSTIYRSACIQYYDADGDGVGTAFVGTSASQTYELLAPLCIDRVRLNDVFYRVTDDNDGVTVVLQSY